MTTAAFAPAPTKTRRADRPLLGPGVAAYYAETVIKFGLACVDARLASERTRLVGQPAQGCDGRRGTVTRVAYNCDGRLVATLHEHKGYPHTYFVEDVQTAAELVAA